MHRGGVAQPESVPALTGVRCYCHLYAREGDAPISVCGVPRAEQEPHTRPAVGPVVARVGVCPSCGLDRCPVCRRVAGAA